MANSVIDRPAVSLTTATAPRPSNHNPLYDTAGRVGFWIVSLSGYFFLWAPIVLLVVFSFNDGKSVNAWYGFTFRWYEGIFSSAVGGGGSFQSDALTKAVVNSMIVSVIATVISTLIGMMVALSLSRGRYPGKRYIEGLLLLPVIIPEITQGISLAMFFKLIFDFVDQTTGVRVYSGFGTIIIGHVVFNISYVAVVVRARLAEMNPRLEEAAYDLGANGWNTFRRITLPLMMPGIVAGALLAFTLSLDDFVVTFMLAGSGNTTLPVFVYNLLKVSVTPDINAVSTLMLIASTILIGISLILQGRSRS